MNIFCLTSYCFGFGSCIVAQKSDEFILLKVECSGRQSRVVHVRWRIVVIVKQ
uniref:Uncharacterized protein n=1 Tax=Arundo donax TaxID=35708 RepID=A0A0A9C8P9_ARUDO